MPLKSGFTVIPGSIVTLPPGGVTTVNLLDASVTNPKLAPNAVTTDKIADGTIIGADIADNSVPASKLLDGSIDPAKLGPGAIPKSKLGPLAIVDADVTGPISGAKISTPVKQQVQFNGAAVPVETILNFIGTAGLLDVADEPAATRTNINLQGIITSQPAKGTDGQVKSVGGEAGNTVGPASAWSAADHGHYLKLAPIAANPAVLPFAASAGGAVDASIERSSAGQLVVKSTLTVQGVAGTPGLILTPASGQRALAWSAGDAFLDLNGVNARIGCGANRLELYGGLGVIPSVDTLLGFGDATHRWNALYASNGTIQTSDPAQKSDLTPVDPADALADVLAAEILEYELPSPTADDPGATMHHVGFSGTQAPARLRVRRKVHGDVVTSAEVEANSTASMALAAIQALSAQLVTVTAQLAAVTGRLATLEGVSPA